MKLNLEIGFSRRFIGDFEKTSVSLFPDKLNINLKIKKKTV